MIKIIFFDVGNVLITLNEDPRKKIARYLGLDWETYKAGHKKAEEDRETYKGWDDIQTLEKEKAWSDKINANILKYLGIEPTKERVDFMTDAWLKKDYRLNDGVIETLAYLKSKYRLGIISNGMASRRGSELTYLKLLDYFDPVIISREISIDKPKPGIYEAALEAAKVKADEAAFIDDVPSALEGAAKLGFGKLIQFDWDQYPTDNDFIKIRKIEELKEVFK